MSQKDFAKKVGIACSTVSDWKRKKTNPQSEYIVPICEALEITPTQLLTGEDTDERLNLLFEDFIVSESDMRLLKDIRDLKEGQYKRLMTYLKALKTMEALEDFNESKAEL